MSRVSLLLAVTCLVLLAAGDVSSLLLSRIVRHIEHLCLVGEDFLGFVVSDNYRLVLVLPGNGGLFELHFYAPEIGDVYAFVVLFVCGF